MVFWFTEYTQYIIHSLVCQGNNRLLAKAEAGCMVVAEIGGEGVEANKIQTYGVGHHRCGGETWCHQGTAWARQLQRTRQWGGRAWRLVGEAPAWRQVDLESPPLRDLWSSRHQRNLESSVLT